MIRIFSITLLVVCMTATAFAQFNECGTPDISENEYMALPWYGDEEDAFLNNFYDSLQAAMGGGYPAARGIIQDVWFRIPIHFWVYQINSTTPGGVNPNQFPNELSLQRLMDAVNTSFRNNGIKIQFYLDCFSNINNVTGITVDGFVQENLLANAYRQTGKINVHIVDELVGAGGKFNALYNAIFIPRTVAANMDNAETLTHELGHFFGLLHTHFGAGIPCLQEPVTRGRRVTPCPNGPGYSKRCKWTGDLLCDTPADPNMGGDTPFNLRPDENNCTYVRNQTDQNGDTYNPDVSNFMAYGNIGCRSTFSSGQIKWMYWWLLNMQVPLSSGASWFMVNNNTAFDIYEPDNVAITARTIDLGETQEHSFYGAASGACEDVVDWLRFQYPTQGSSGLLRLEVRDITNPNPVNEINIYLRNLNGTTGARLWNLNTIIVPGLRYVDLSCETLFPGQEYLIEITRDQNNIGLYEVTLIDIVASLTITSSPLVCTSNTTIGLSNPPVGTTVIWTASPSNLFATSGGASTSGPGTTATVRAANSTVSGPATITFTINSVCGVPVQIPKSIWVGTRKPLDLISVVVDPWLGRIKALVEPVPDATGYLWYRDGILYTGPGQNSDYVTMPIPRNNCSIANYSVGVKAINACGNSATYSELHINPCYEGTYYYSYFPNPAFESLTIEKKQPSNTENLEEESNSLKTETIFHNYRLYDLNSNIIVAEGTLFDKTKIDVSTLPKGRYVLKIRLDKETEETHHVIIN